MQIEVNVLNRFNNSLTPGNTNRQIIVIRHPSLNVKILKPGKKKTYYLSAKEFLTIHLDVDTGTPNSRVDRVIYHKNLDGYVKIHWKGQGAPVVGPSNHGRDGKKFLISNTIPKYHVSISTQKISSSKGQTESDISTIEFLSEEVPLNNVEVGDENQLNGKHLKKDKDKDKDKDKG